MPSRTIELSAGGTMPAYVAEPGERARGGIIVIQEIFGVSQPIKDVAEMLADQGYLAIVPAMFHRIDPHFAAGYDDAGREAGTAAMRKTTVADICADLASAAAYLREHLGSDATIAVWGFCYGGSIAYLAASLPFVDASISFYGAQIARSSIPGLAPFVERTPAIRVPLFLAFGGKDQGITAEHVSEIRAALENAGKTFDLEVYPDAGHAFFRNGPESSDSARDAWERVKTFLAQHRKG